MPTETRAAEAHEQDWRTMPAGRELDALVAERVMGEQVTPSRDYALTIVGTANVVVTGREFTLKNGDVLPMPHSTALRQPDGFDMDTNARYFLHVGEYLLATYPAHTERQIAAVRLPVKPYSTDIAAAWQVLDRMMQTHFMFGVNGNHESGYWCTLYPSSGAPVETDSCDSPAEAICKAALAARALAAGAGRGEVGT